ncbi:MAG TPA: hypothetical protein VFW33_17875 [Gemmataceae bacterium]|nr:hypothetical protein [Gemmataceae bacterium]
MEGEGAVRPRGSLTPGPTPALATPRLVRRDWTTMLRRLSDPTADPAAGFLGAVGARKPAARGLG